MEKYKAQLYEPEIFVEQSGKIKAIKVDPKKSIAEQLAEGAERAARDNTARPTPEKKTYIDR